MAAEGSIEYALARVQARYGERPGENEWRRIEASRDLGQYLEAVRASSLADWVSSIDRTHDAHAIDRALRIAWRRYVDSIAAWHPSEWQPWLEWLEWLPTLSLLAQLKRPEPAPSWMMADPLLGPIAPGLLAERIAASKAASLAAFAPALKGEATIGDLWWKRWQALRPQSDAHTRELLDTVLRALDAYAQESSRATGISAAPRRQLADRLRKLFRAGAGTVAATLCYLGLLAFDVERLRGGLIGRVLFAARAPQAA